MENESQAGYSREAKTAELKYELADQLQVDANELELKNPEQYLEGSRFLYFFTDRSFGKLSQSISKEQLRKESNATVIANNLGLETVSVHVPYTEIDENRAFFTLEKLDLSQGMLLPSVELIASIEGDELAAIAKSSAKTILSVSEKPIPNNLSNETLTRNDNRNTSPDGVKDMLGRATSRVLDSKLANFVSDTVGPTTVNGVEMSGYDQCAQLKDELINNIDILTNQWPETEEEYFVHNDASPNNMFYWQDKADPNNTRAMLLDFEHGGATHWPVLAMLTDVENFYGRLWPNPDLQTAFAKESLKLLADHCNTPEEVEDRKTIIRTAMIFGSFYLSSFPLAKAANMLELDGERDVEAVLAETKESAMARNLLGSLVENLAQLDEDCAQIINSMSADNLSSAQEQL